MCGGVVFLIDTKIAAMEPKFDAKFAAMDSKFAAIDTKFAAMDTKFSALNDKLDLLLKPTLGVEERVRSLEFDRERQIGRKAAKSSEVAARENPE